MIDISMPTGFDGEGGYRYCYVNGVKTKVYTKYLTGTLDGFATENIAHGVANGLTKILSSSGHAYNDNASWLNFCMVECRMADSGANNLEIGFNDTNIVFGTKGSNLMNNNYRIEINYML